MVVTLTRASLLMIVRAFALSGPYTVDADGAISERRVKSRKLIKSLQLLMKILPRIDTQAQARKRLISYKFCIG